MGIFLTLFGAAPAQNYPSKSLTMIIPFAAGGPTDVLGRVIAQRMSEIMGQQVVVENVGGAGGITESKRVADAASDGYTFVLGTVGTHAQGQSLSCSARVFTQTSAARLIALLGSTAAAWPRAGWTQQPEGMRRVGVLIVGEAFRLGP